MFDTDLESQGQQKTGSLRKRIGRYSGLFLICYFGIIIYFVLFSDSLGRSIGYNDYQYNLVPFQEIRRFIVYRDTFSYQIFFINLIGNLLIFAPLGFLLPLMRMKKTGLIRIIICGFLMSLCIELTQLVTKVGVFDVDDLLLNTLGSMIGYFIFLITKPFLRQQYRYLEDKNNASD